MIKTYHGFKDQFKKFFPTFVILFLSKTSKFIYKNLIYNQKLIDNIYFTKFNLKYFFIKFFILRKKNKLIDCNLILIGQVQRSGGTLLNQLFDDHFEIFSYPSELILRKPKSQWYNGSFHFSPLVDRVLRESIKTKNFSKRSKKSEKIFNNNRFNFNPYLQKYIFNELKDKNLRNNFNAYFTSFFNSFENYSSTYDKKKFIVTHLPKFIFFEENIKLFFQIYPKGYIISIIRDPLTWIRSAKNVGKKSFSTELNELLKIWEKNFDNSLKFKKLFKNRIILINFNQLINETEAAMKLICSKINIKYHNILLTPTFNGEALYSNSSFKPSKGKIDKNVINDINLEKIKSKLERKDIIRCLKKFEELNSQS